VKTIYSITDLSIKRIRDLFKYALYKFTLYLLTYAYVLFLAVYENRKSFTKIPLSISISIVHTHWYKKFHKNPMGGQRREKTKKTITVSFSKNKK